MTRVHYPSLEHVALEKRPYPADLLAGCKSGLVLFAAAFLGHNDAIHFAEAGVPDVTLVDVDGPRLDEMQELYRDPSWNFREDDAFEFARVARAAGLRWDAVSVDPFSGAALERTLVDLSQWTALASRLVAVTLTRGEVYVVPRGWRRLRVVERSSSAYWLVLVPGVGE